MKDSREVPPPGGFRILSNEEARLRAGGISRRTWDLMRQQGTGPEFVRIGRRRVGYTEQALRDWAAGRTVRSTAQVGGAA